MPVPLLHISKTVDGVTVSLSPVEVAGARIVNGKTFPLALAVSSTDLQNSKATEKALELISKDGTFTRLLTEHGAVLVRGLGDSSAQAFSQFVSAIEFARGNEPFQQIGLAGKRHFRADHVFTANEGPPSVRFYQHNEYARYNHFPSNIHFWCAQKPAVGGGSPIAHSGELFARVQEEIPDLVRNLSEKNLISVQVYPSKTYKSTAAKGNEFYWEGPDTFGHHIVEGDSIEEMKRKAEVQVRKLTDDFSWNADGSLTVRQHVPAFREHPVTKQPIFFNGLVGRFGTSRDRKALEPPYKGIDGGVYMPTTYEDGEIIQRDWQEKLLGISRELEFNHKWEEGDLVLIDNYQVLHGREPWTGDRLILVSMWDDNVKPRAYKV